MLVNERNNSGQATINNFNINNNNNVNFCEKSILSTIVKAAESCSTLEQRSNTSSLESLDSPLMDDNRAISTSCSSDSFEMSSTTSHIAGDLSTPSDSSYPRHPDFMKTSSSSAEYFENSNTRIMKQDSLASSSSYNKSSESLTAISEKPEEDAEDSQHKQNTDSDFHWLHKPTTSKSMGSLSTEANSKTGLDALRESIEKELSDLDTCLPKLDFNKLEEKLNCAAQERLVTERKLLGEQVRRRLALQVDELTAGPSPRVSTRPSRSNLGHRLQTAMNLQVCYVNGMEDEEVLDEESSDDDEFDIPKSKSVPNLRGCVQDGSTLNASELRQKSAITEPENRRSVLEEETKMMLAKAKQTARLQMELERLNSVSFGGKYTRLQLSRVAVKKLRELVDELTNKICAANGELVQLLVERDQLHMQQDSMLVDIEDMIQHQSNSESTNLPEVLKVQGKTPKKFHFFKRSK